MARADRRTTRIVSTLVTCTVQVAIAAGVRVPHITRAIALAFAREGYSYAAASFSDTADAQEQ